MVQISSYLAAYPAVRTLSIDYDRGGNWTFKQYLHLCGGAKKSHNEDTPSSKSGFESLKIYDKIIIKKNPVRATITF